MNERRAPVVRVGFPASEGIARGRVRRIVWRIPELPHTVVQDSSSARELERFHSALDHARRELERIKAATEARLGHVEARIFDPQILMLDDPEVVDGTARYIRENRLAAARAFDWRMLELKELWSRTSHPMFLDRLNDLADLRFRVLGRLLDLPSPWRAGDTDGIVIVARELAPSLVAGLDPERVAALATDEGTRTSHWAILARSLGIPAVAGLGDIAATTSDGQAIIVDGRSGRVVVEPDRREAEHFRRRRAAIRGWERELRASAGEEAITLDQRGVVLRANLDLPGEALQARRHGADGVGLFRTEFLVVGRHTVPDEEEQYRAYRIVTEAFRGRAVFIRTFDLGGDKFPVFLHMPPEENPFLGRRGVRVCLEESELFLTQLRAILRAGAHGDVRIMIPMVNTVSELAAVRELLDTAGNQLGREGIPFAREIKVGAMIETPAAALKAPELAAHADFLSIGTNDLVQYTLAIDRTSTRLAHQFDEFDPAVLRMIAGVARAGRSRGIEVGACGEMAARPLGAAILLGLGVEALSVAWASLPEIRKLVRSFRLDDLRAAASDVLEAPTSTDAKRALTESLGDVLDVGVFPLGT